MLDSIDCTLVAPLLFLQFPASFFKPFMYDMYTTHATIVSGIYRKPISKVLTLSKAGMLHPLSKHYVSI